MDSTRPRGRDIEADTSVHVRKYHSMRAGHWNYCYWG